MAGLHQDCNWDDLWKKYYRSCCWGCQSCRSFVSPTASTMHCVGCAYPYCTRYISELSPSAFRGRLVTVSILFITGGQVIAYVLGYVLAQRLHGWRWMVGLGAVPAVVQFFLLLKLPETPRWLVEAGKEDVARVVLKKVYASKTNTAPEQVLKEIRREIVEEQATSKLVNPVTPGNDGWPSLTQFQNRMTELLFVGGNRRALTIACMVQALQQLCGFVSFVAPIVSKFTDLECRTPLCTSRPPYSLYSASHLPS